MAVAEPPRVVLPGDEISGAAIGGDATLRLGPGLRQRQNKGGKDEGGIVLEAYRTGVLRTKEKPLSAWVDSSHKHAIAVQDEQVLGVVTACPGESYSVDIGSNMLARLHSLSFEGATKRNKPRLQIGDLVYGRLTLCNKDMEPELSCVTTGGKANGMGKLEGGFMVECSLGLSRKLMKRNSEVLAQLGKVYQYELGIGQNGRIWVKAPRPSDTIIVANAILASEFMDGRQIKRMVHRLSSQRS